MPPHPQPLQASETVTAAMRTNNVKRMEVVEAIVEDTTAEYVDFIEIQLILYIHINSTFTQSEARN